MLKRPQRAWFTPTPVGKTSVQEAAGQLPLGSPPRLWGKLFSVVWQFIQRRFTPTPVGKTQRFAILPRLWRGSPPRLWGKHWMGYATPARERFTPTPVGKTRIVVLTKYMGARFTPTPVGKTRSTSARELARTVHPHACGENTIDDRMIERLDGSPPRLWGKLSRPRSHCKPIRFTPTPVGKTHCANGHRVGRGRFTPTPVGKTSPMSPAS